MKMTTSSVPIGTKSYAIGNMSAEEIIPLGAKGATSYSYRVRIDGREHFMKQLRPELKDDWRYRSAYQKEYEVGRAINSNYIVRYEAIDENADGLYIFMEHVNGHTLEEKLAMEPEYFARGRNFEKLFVQLLKGLKALHEKQVAYLDLKPDNVMLTQVNDDVKIIDLGFCFANAYGHTAGFSYEYAAPELRDGNLDRVDARTDIYAVGRLMKYIKEAACVDVPKRLGRVIGRCIQPAMQDRYADVDEVLKAVTKKRRWVARCFVALMALLALCVGVEELTKNEYYKILKQRTKWLLKPADYDFKYDRINYRILSEDSLTCMAVGGKRMKNIYIHDIAYHEGKEYRTVAVGADAFAGRYMESVYIPDGVKEIGPYAFCRCRRLLSLHLPQSVEKIGDYSFEMLGEMRSLRLSSNIKEIPRNAFVCCDSLKILDIPEGVEVLGLDCFAMNKSLEEVVLPSTITTINRGAFWNSRMLKKVVIPASVTTIGEYVFFNCWQLTDVYCYAPVPLSIPPMFNKKGVILHVPRDSEKLYRQAEHWNVAEVVGDL